MNGTEKWIYAPSATFEGTKASLFEKQVLSKREAQLSSKHHLICLQITFMVLHLKK